MRTHILTASLLLAAGCRLASAETGDTAAAPPSAVIGVMGDCPTDAGPMRPGPAGAMVDLNRDGYGCTLHFRSIAGDTMHLVVDNDAPGSGVMPEPYIGM